MDDSTRRQYQSAIDDLQRDVRRYESETVQLRTYLGHEQKSNLQQEYINKIAHTSANIAAAQQKIAQLRREM